MCVCVCVCVCVLTLEEYCEITVVLNSHFVNWRIS